MTCFKILETLLIDFKKNTVYRVTRSEELKAVIYVTSSANKASET